MTEREFVRQVKELRRIGGRVIRAQGVNVAWIPDIYQEAVCKAWRSLERATGDFKPWFLCICKNAAIDWVRRPANREWTGIPWGMEDPHALDPIAEIEARESLHFEPGYEWVAAMREAGFSGEFASRSLGMSLAAYKARLWRLQQDEKNLRTFYGDSRLVS